MADKNAADLIANEIAENDQINMDDVEMKTYAKRAERSLNELQKRQSDFLAKVRAEKKVPISIAPQYNAEFSNNMRVVINGISIFIPVDGNEYQVPETFAAEIKRRIHKVNQKHNRLKRKGTAEKISLVEENAPGEIKLF